MGELQLVALSFFGKSKSEYKFIIYPFPNENEEYGCLCLMAKKTEQENKYSCQFLIDASRFRDIIENKIIQEIINSSFALNES